MSHFLLGATWHAIIRCMLISAESQKPRPLVCDHQLQPQIALVGIVNAGYVGQNTITMLSEWQVMKAKLVILSLVPQLRL